MLVREMIGERILFDGKTTILEVQSYESGLARSYLREALVRVLSPYRNGNPYQQAVFQIFFHVFKIIYMQDKDNISAIQNKD